MKHITDEKYVDDYLNMESNPRLLKFECRGELNKDKAIYIIKENGSGWGYFAEFRTLLCKLLYAERFGFYPYICWGKKFLYFDEDFKTSNAYEYFFDQPKVLQLEEVNNSYIVAESKSADAVLIEREFAEKDNYGMTNECLNEMTRVFKKYVRFNAETKRKLCEDFKEIKCDEESLLGVHFRGTDYKKEYDNHPVFIQLQEEINRVREIYSQKHYKKIFLATDEENAVAAFEEVFGKDNICYYKDVFRGSGDISVAFSEANRLLHKYTLGYEVLRDAWTLSMCDGLVAGVSQVSTFAQIIKYSREEKYVNKIIINKGVNNNNNKFKSF